MPPTSAGVRRSTPADDNPFTFALSRDGATLAVCGQFCVAVELWDYREARWLARRIILPEPYRKSVAGHAITSTHVASMSFSDDDRRLALGCWDCSAKVLDLETGGLTEVRPRDRDNVEFVAFSRDDPTRLTTGTPGGLGVWDLACGRRIEERRLPGFGWRHLSMGGDGRILSLSHDGTLLVLDGGLGDEATSRIRYKPPATCLAIAEAHGLLAIGQEDGRVVFWDLAARKVAGTLRLAGDLINSLDFSPTGNRICVVGAGRTGRVSEVEWAR